MMQHGQERRSALSNPWWLLVAAGVLLVAGGLAGWVYSRTQVEQIVRETILANPEILPEAMENLQRKQASRQLSGIRADVEKPFRGAMMGNPAGKTTLVEFTDFACGFCRQSLPDVKKLLASDPDLRIVVRELPILSPQSIDAARMALAAAEQGKYEAFHDAMFAAGRPDAETIEAAARQAGLNLARARAFAQSPEVEAELGRNVELARQLGFNGTPSWVVGDVLLSGAVGAERLAQAIADARS